MSQPDLGDVKSVSLGRTRRKAASWALKSVATPE